MPSCRAVRCIYVEKTKKPQSVICSKLAQHKFTVSETALFRIKHQMLRVTQHYCYQAGLFTVNKTKSPYKAVFFCVWSLYRDLPQLNLFVHFCPLVRCIFAQILGFTVQCVCRISAGSDGLTLCHNMVGKVRVVLLWPNFPRFHIMAFSSASDKKHFLANATCNSNMSF